MLAALAHGTEIHNMRNARDATRHWRRRLAGWLWFIIWMVLLWTIVSPWREIGGLVSERLRWLESVTLPSALIAGGVAGRLARDAARAGRGRCHAGLLRLLLLPPAALTAAALLLMRLVGWNDQIGIVFSAFMGYWAGMDMAFGAYPLMEGRHYSFSGPIFPSGRRSDSRDGLSPWLGG
jgi:hypothetical protein